MCIQDIYIDFYITSDLNVLLCLKKGNRQVLLNMKQWKMFSSFLQIAIQTTSENETKTADGDGFQISVKQQSLKIGMKKGMFILKENEVNEIITNISLINHLFYYKKKILERIKKKYY